MPQLTDRFGPIQQQVSLNSSGNGQVTFQPNGSNCRITNLFVKVATATNQAVCTMYKGQVADSNIVASTNSGSTGAAATGAIDLQDGETLYVVWIGGDANALATATFVGITIPFDQTGPSAILWDNPIAAGDGSIIFPALKSPNFATGVSGWRIARDGSVEFNNAVIRGSVIAGNGVVTINSNGIEVVGTTYTYIIDKVSGFFAEFTASTGANSQLIPGVLFLQPDNPSVDGHAITPAEILADVDDQGGGIDAPRTSIFSPTTNGKANGALNVFGESSDGSIKSHININTSYVDSGFVDSKGHEWLRGENKRFFVSFTSLNSFNLAQTFTHPFTIAPCVTCNIEGGAGSTARWTSRAINVSTTGFTQNFAYMSDGTSTFTWTNVLCTFTATEPTP